MRNKNIILFYIILILIILSGLKFKNFEYLIYIAYFLMILSLYLTYKYKGINILPSKNLGKYKIINFSALYGIIIISIGLYSIHLELLNTGAKKNFLNFYYLFYLNVYLFLLMSIKLKKKK